MGARGVGIIGTVVLPGFRWGRLAWAVSLMRRYRGLGA